MKALNTMQFIASAAERLAEYRDNISNAETYETAKAVAERAIGYVDAMITFQNTMIHADNNEFSDEFDDVLARWQSRVYEALIKNAHKTNQDRDTIISLLRKRDAFRQ